MRYIFPVDVPWNIVLIVGAASFGLGLALAWIWGRWGKTMPRWLTPRTVVWVLAGTYFVFFTAASLGRHYAMATCAFDLGYYGNVVWQFGHGHFLEQAIAIGDRYSQPFTPILALLAPLSWIFRDPAYLLVIQAACLAGAIILVYKIADPPGTSGWLAVALAASFALAPTLHGANLYDFHPRALGVPLALAAYYFFARGRFTPGLLFTIAVALCREDLAAIALALALWGGLATRHRRAGTVAAAILGVYFVGFILLLYPHLTFARGVGPLQSWIFTRHLQLLSHEAAPAAEPLGRLILAKASYLAAGILPLALFMGSAGSALLTAGAAALVPAASSMRATFMMGIHYPLAFIPFIYGTAAVGLRRAQASPGGRFRLRAAAIAAVLFQVGMIAAYIKPYYRPTLGAVIPSLHDRALLALTHRIPARIPIATDDPFSAHLAHRRHCFYFPHYIPEVILPTKPRLLILNRRLYSPRDFQKITAAAALWDLRLERADGDSALFSRDAPARSDEAFFRKWFGTLEEWQCAPQAPGDREVRDPAALNGRAFRTRSSLWLEPGENYTFPAGDYGFTFLLRCAAGPGSVELAVDTTDAGTTCRAHRGASYPLPAGPAYRSYPVRIHARRPFTAVFRVTGDTPFYFDALSINSAAWNAAAFANQPAPPSIVRAP